MGAIDPAVTALAHRQADAAAGAAGVTVTMVDSHDGALIVEDIVTAVWPQDDGSSEVQSSLLRALQLAGGYVCYATDPTGLPVAACFSFFSAPADARLHSHAAGVIASHAGRGIGRALKLHQRAWALDRGVTEIEWTYDPTIARNAFFNLGRLGARPAAHRRDVYGEMRELRNRGFGSDRLLVVWELTDPAVVAAASRTRGQAAPTPTPWAGPGRSAIPIPPDIETLRVEDPAAAARWRVTVRDALEGVFASGARIVGFEPEQGYLVEAPASGAPR